jgi:ubiquinone/menaquinone biosynthesis C-methylase UbiE
VCSSCGAGYSLEGGVPRFIAYDPTHGGSGGIRRLLESERLYDLLQLVLGYRIAARRLQSALGDTRGRVLLDVGGGTGNLIPYLSEGTHYVCLDNDPEKLDRLLRKRPGTMAVLADATRLPFADKSVDETVCVAITHHLSDDALSLLIDELARVTRGRVTVFDPLREERTRRGKLLWRIDRGSFPRTEPELASFLVRSLTPQHQERFAIHHHYLLWAGVPHE